MIEGTVKLNMRYRKGYSDILVGQCREYPFIIVEGKTIDDLTETALHELEVYLNTFKEERKRFIKRFQQKPIQENSEIGTDKKEQQQEGWMEMKIEVPRIKRK
jgi:hypothetical protein